jgi:glycosyltransferase involved in cell wall biosynthesis
MDHKGRLLIVSPVLPFPRRSGQQQRVYHSLKALREKFHLTFLTVGEPARIRAVRENLLELCDALLVLPSRYARSNLSKAWYRLAGGLYRLGTGLKFSNYLINAVEFAPGRLAAVLNGKRYDCALFEYWHAVDLVPFLQQQGVACVLDMHNILWQSYRRQLEGQICLTGSWARWALEQYRQREERAWTRFDALIAINAAEALYVKLKTPAHPVFYAPMGADLEEWPYLWAPATPPRLAYYGGLGSRHNQQDALTCYRDIMPGIWESIPKAELWLVGSQPPKKLEALAAADPRLKVTGTLEKPQEILKTMSVVLCPWAGTYGFRSRIIEVLALGVPVVASPEAVYGMDLEDRRGILLEPDAAAMAQACLTLIQGKPFSVEQSRLARTQVTRHYSFENTYGKLAEDVYQFSRPNGN